MVVQAPLFGLPICRMTTLVSTQITEVNMSRIRVAVAVIIQHGKVLIAKRHPDLHQGGKWEFPGGKIESGESESDATIRELREELSITATVLTPFMEVDFDYPDKQVSLKVWLVTDFSGIVQGAEGQATKWVSVAELQQHTFPAANYPILKKIISEFRAEPA